jgi:hypothetical protein
VIWRRPVCLPLDDSESSILVATQRPAAAAPDQSSAPGNGSGGADATEGNSTSEPARQPSAVKVRREPICVGGECFQSSIQVMTARVEVQPQSQPDLRQGSAFVGFGDATAALANGGVYTCVSRDVGRSAQGGCSVFVAGRKLGFRLTSNIRCGKTAACQVTIQTNRPIIAGGNS